MGGLNQSFCRVDAWRLESTCASCPWGAKLNGNDKTPLQRFLGREWVRCHCFFHPPTSLSNSNAEFRLGPPQTPPPAPNLGKSKVLFSCQSVTRRRKSTYKRRSNGRQTCWLLGRRERRRWSATLMSTHTSEFIDMHWVSISRYSFACVKPRRSSRCCGFQPAAIDRAHQQLRGLSCLGTLASKTCHYLPTLSQLRL